MQSFDPDHVVNYKPVFQKFCEANEKLLLCYHGLAKEDVLGVPASALDGKCAKEKSELKSILASNEMTMTALVRDRVNVLYKLDEYEIACQASSN
jgi:hypothetical protein